MTMEKMKLATERAVYQIPFSPPDISEAEIDEVAAAMRSGWITTGRRTKLFESRLAQYIGVGAGRVACLSSATAALELTLRVLGVGPGDEVITSAYTYTASAAVIDHVGARIVFADVKPGTYEIDEEAVAKAITERTKAVIPVDVGGMMIDYDRLAAAVESRKSLWRPTRGTRQELFDRVVLLADAAHSFGATYHGRTSGSVADFSCFSFHAVKNLTTGEGGAVAWKRRDNLDDAALYKAYQLLSLHGQDRDALAKSQCGKWEYDILCTGYKYNMTDLAAGFGLKQLERFDGLADRRREISDDYDDWLGPADECALPGQIERMAHRRPGRQGNYHLYMTRVPGITLEQRSDIIAAMGERGVACNVHFKPLPLMTAYRNLGFRMEDYPEAYRQYKSEITLPLHTLLTDDQAAYVAETFLETLKPYLHGRRG